MNGSINRFMDGMMDGSIYGWMDGRTDRRREGGRDYDEMILLWYDNLIAIRQTDGQTRQSGRQ